MSTLSTISIRRTLFFCLTLVALVQFSQAQISNTVGKEFYLTFLPNNGYTSYETTVHLVATFTTSGSIEVIGTDFYQEFTVNAGSSLEIEIPDEYKLKENVGIQQSVVYISTRDDVTVYAYNHVDGDSDGTIVLPLEALDKEYLVHVKGSDTQMSVFATDDDTDIQITLAADSVLFRGDHYNKGEHLQMRLDRGESVLLSSKFDLSGSQVRVVQDGTVDCKKLGVFVANGPFGFEGYRYNQLYAARDWAKEYFALLFKEPFNSGDIHIMAAEDNTRLDMTGVPTRFLDRGESFVVQAKIEHFIQSDKPISVIHTGAGVMNLLSPLKQISRDILFEIIHKDASQEYFISIFTPTDGLLVLLDGEDISSEFETVQLANEYSFAVVPIDRGVHRLQADQGLVAFTYGVSGDKGATYALGGNLGNFQIALENLNSDLPPDQTCVGSDISLQAQAENDILTELYTEFQWDMGDGTIIYGENVVHQYSAPGNYEITLFASKSPIACSDLRVSRTIEVQDAAIESIAGPDVICPNVGSVAYELTGSEPDYTYQWFAVGGTINSSNGPTAMVSWNYGASENTLKAVSVSPVGCISDTVRLNIQYKPVLEPIMPLGPSSVCGDFTGINYYVPSTSGSIYDWRVVGGTVVSGQGTSSIVVDWDGPGTHSILYHENSTTFTDYCEGTSPFISVVVSEAIDVEFEIGHVTCHGQNDGSASLTINGGISPFSVEWSTGSTQNSITGLAGGRYEVSITDGVGCVATHEVIVEEPEMLSGHLVVENAACSGNTGMATAVIEGGMGPYRYNWGRDFTSDNTNSGLGVGNYRVTVHDARGCELVMNYSIEVPQPLLVEFEKQSPCPGVAEGSLRVMVEGGTEPYEFEWTHDPTNALDEALNLAGGDYQLRITDAEGCTISLNEHLSDLAPMVTLPTAFSPNGDGDNDRFEAVYNCVVDFRMYIYNQWGTLVFASDLITEGWDGTYDGEPVPSGEYAYHIIYTTGGSSEFRESIKGQLRLLR